MFWLNLLLLVLLTAGHTELLVTFVNRAHSFKIARPKLRRLRHLDDVLIAAFPLALLWWVGLNGPAVLRGGSWSELSLGWKAYFALCGFGCAGLIWSSVRWRLRRPAGVQLSNHSQTIDVAARLGYRPQGNGPYRYLMPVPGNEIFRVQVSDKRFALPRLPEDWHGLSILHLSDTHFTGAIDRPFFEEITRVAAEMRPDLVVFTGDLLDEPELLRWLPETFGRLCAPLGCYYVLGNHDWFHGDAPIREAFDRLGWQPVAGRLVSLEHRGRRLEIGGTELPWMGEHPRFSREADAFRLLLSHTPDHFAWACRQGVDVMLAGHNHGGQVVLPFIGPVFAPSRHGVRYASGAFWSEPTLMYVTRGLSGRHPLRLNCAPELTRIVLESPATARPR
jgi:predicted MPP superfamily phosphohydrolase